MEGGVAILCKQLLLHNLHDHVTCLSAALWISIDCDGLCIQRESNIHWYTNDGIQGIMLKL